MADHRVRIVWQFRDKLQQCEVCCRGCGRAVIYPAALAEARFGGTTLIGELERRLRCTHCGAKGARVRGVWRER